MYLVVFSGVIFLLYEMAYEGWGLAWNAWPQMPTSIPISFFWIYLSVPVGSVIMILILVEHWLLALAGIIDPERGSVPEFGDAELVHAEEAKLSGE